MTLPRKFADENRAKFRNKETLKNKGIPDMSKVSTAAARQPL
jgi:hypothetical protein